MPVDLTMFGVNSDTPAAPELPPKIVTAEVDRGFSTLDARADGVQRRAQEEAHRVKLEEHSASLITGVTGAWKFDTAVGTQASFMHDIQYAADESFDAGAAMKADPSYSAQRSGSWEDQMLKSAKSQEHYDVLKERIEERKEYMLNAEDLGIIPSMGLQLVAEFANPTNYISFGLGALNKARKIRKAFGAGGVNVAEEVAINDTYHDRTAAMYVAAGAFGLGLGWMGSSRPQGPERYAGSRPTTLGSGLGGLGDGLDDIGKADIGKHIEDVGDNFAITHIKNAADEAKAKVDGEGNNLPKRYTTVAKFTENTEPKDIHDSLHPGGFANRARAFDLDPESAVGNRAGVANLSGELPVAESLPHEKVGLTSMSHSLHTSENAITRQMASELFEFPEGVGRMNKDTAALEADKEFSQFTATYAPEYIRLKAAWMKLAKQSGVSHTFDEAGTLRIHDGRSVQGSSKQMDDILDSLSELYQGANASTYRIMKDSGVEEALGDLDIKHMARDWDGEQFHNLKREHGEQEIVDLFTESIYNGNDFRKMNKEAEATFLKKQDELHAEWEADMATAQKALDDVLELQKKAQKEAPGSASKRLLNKWADARAKVKEVQARKPKKKYQPINARQVAKRMAQAIVHRFNTRATVTTADANLLSSANQTQLLKVLGDLNMPIEDFVHIKHVLDTAGKDHAANPMKHQMGMDLGHSSASGLRIMDFMNNDLASSFASKQRYWLGRAAAARKGYPTEASFQKAVKDMKDLGTDLGMDADPIKADAARLEAGWRMVMGQPIEDMGATGIKAMRIVRKAMATASLGKLGFVQFGETGRMMAAVGVKNLIGAMPVIRDMIMNIKDGRLDTATLKDFEDHALGKIGDEHYMNHPDFRADDFGHKISKGEKALDTMSFWMSKASGWHAVHTAQKKYLMNGLAQKWYREFTTGTMTGPQMRDLGVSEELMESIADNMRKHATDVEGVDGSGAKNLNIGKWDAESRRAFALMLHRKSGNAIQDLMTGETPLWINKGMGKFMGQFRSFSIAALGKQTVRDFRMHKQGDPEAALAFQFMLATSTMAVLARVGFDAAAHKAGPDRDKYLEGRLSVGGIVKQILNYHGQASPLVDAADFLGDSFMPNTWGQITGSSQYRNGRGLSGMIPGVSYLDKVKKGVGGLGKAMMPGESMTKSDWNALTGALPLSSWYGFYALNKGVVTPLLFD